MWRSNVATPPSTVSMNSPSADDVSTDALGLRLEGGAAPGDLVQAWRELADVHLKSARRS
jgi:hypothetical protein